MGCLRGHSGSFSGDPMEILDDRQKDDLQHPFEIPDQEHEDDTDETLEEETDDEYNNSTNTDLH